MRDILFVEGCVMKPYRIFKYETGVRTATRRPTQLARPRHGRAVPRKITRDAANAAAAERHVHAAAVAALVGPQLGVATGAACGVVVDAPNAVIGRWQPDEDLRLMQAITAQLTQRAIARAASPGRTATCRARRRRSTTARRPERCSRARRGSAAPAGAAQRGHQQRHRPARRSQAASAEATDGQGDQGSIRPRRRGRRGPRPRGQREPTTRTTRTTRATRTSRTSRTSRT